MNYLIDKSIETTKSDNDDDDSIQDLDDMAEGDDYQERSHPLSERGTSPIIVDNRGNCLLGDMN